MSISELALVCIGGALGAVLRFWAIRIGALATNKWRFPLPTLFVNLTGSALLGILFGVTNPDPSALLDAPVLLFAGVGFCGSYTTFSSFCTETVALVPHHRGLAITNVILTIVGCVAAFSCPFITLQ